MRDFDNEQERETRAKNIRKRLENYTKGELLRMIGDVCRIDQSACYWFLNAALEIDQQNDERKLQAEEAAGKTWIALEQAYRDMLMPYQGMKFKDIPADVLNRAAETAKKAKQAKEKYMAYWDIAKGAQ